ncbi:multicopper oxidase family protein [Niallia sp. Sow4_A1]|uniref:multicopper oxidase family protein n=1 Tax=Niallia sp. Sow4_A1 TaxID=3438793 RepID=UPI003F9EB036
MKLKILALIGFLLLILSACSNKQNESINRADVENQAEKISSKETTKTEILKGNEFTIVAKEATHQLTKDISVDAWTFNGSVPGSQIRVKQGEKVKINLINELPDPVTIHWHGIVLPNKMDGIPGVTQNAVQPGETFTYEFTPQTPGTYMYHTHQDGVNQLDKGLYGALIVEPKEKTYDRDYTLMLDEWMSNPEEGMDMSDMEGMDMGESDEMEGMDMDMDTSNDGASMTMDDMSEYDIFTINGKSGESIEPLKLKEGETVRLRLANIGYMTHKMHLHGQKFKVVAVDGQEIENPEVIENQLISISPGERYDIEFVADNPGEWYLECHGNMEGTAGMKVKLQYEGSSLSTDKPNQDIELPEFTYTNYGSSKDGKFTLNQKYDVEYTMNLNTEVLDNNMAYTINGKAFPNTENIMVKEGDLVKVKIVNNSNGEDHPMHLHGTSFQILSKNGKKLEGASIVKDTVNLESGDEYEIAFKADNPGNWLFHCHDLHHASAGMVTMVKYKGFQPNFTPDENANNQPE